MLVGPELACGTDSSLDLINDHVNAELLCKCAKSLCKFWGKLVVSTFALDRLEDDGDDLAALLCLPLLDFSSHIDQREAVLLAVVIFVLSQRVLVVGALSGWPVKSWNVDLVSGFCSCG